MVTKVSNRPRILSCGDLSGNLVGNLTRQIAEFPVWARMVKEALTPAPALAGSNRKSLQPCLSLSHAANG
jgi:hypothetical protein